MKSERLSSWATTFANLAIILVGISIIAVGGWAVDLHTDAPMKFPWLWILIPIALSLATGILSQLLHIRAALEQK
jgi:hypothetical protein